MESKQVTILLDSMQLSLKPPNMPYLFPLNLIFVCLSLKIKKHSVP